MALVTMTARIDPYDKAEFEHFCNAVGVNCSTMINMFVKNVLRNRKVPFALEYYPTPNEETIQAMQDTLEGKNLSRKFHNLDEMWEELDA